MEEVEWPELRIKVKLQDHSIKTLGNQMQTERMHVHLNFFISLAASNNTLNTTVPSTFIIIIIIIIIIICYRI